jgi:hypothetical protein
MTRAAWRWWYREIRIVRRECEKGMMDLMIHGSSFIRVDADGAKHVPYNDIHTEDRT